MTGLPPGWPGELPHPTHEAFVDRAVLWLLDHAPSQLRDEPALRRLPIVLAHLVGAQVDAEIAGTRAAYAALRRELPELDAATVEEALAATGRVGIRLQALRREMSLVESALRDLVDRDGRA